MKFRNILLAFSILTLTACGVDDSPSMEELEAKQAGVEFHEKGSNIEIVDTNSAKKSCAIKLSQIVRGSTISSPAIIKSCDCIVRKVSLADIKTNGVLEADNSVTNRCIGN